MNEGDHKRLAKHAVQRRYSRRGYLVSGQPLFHERKAKTTAYVREKFLRQRQVRASDRSALHGQSRNVRQRHPPRQQNRRGSARNHKINRERPFQLPRVRDLGRTI